jgi:hypothetical protein
MWATSLLEAALARDRLERGEAASALVRERLLPSRAADDRTNVR